LFGGFEALAHFIAVHLRHVDIQQNQVRRIPRGFLERQEWVLEEEAVYGTVRDQRNRSPISATAGASRLQPMALACEPTTAATDLVVGPGSLTAGTLPRYGRQRICRQCFTLWKGLAETGGSSDWRVSSL
jgi:hypothetical protein